MWWIFAFILLGLYVALKLVSFNDKTPSEEELKRLNFKDRE